MISLFYHDINLSSTRFWYQNVINMKTTSKTIFDSKYNQLITRLVQIRHAKGITQRTLALLLGTSHCFIGRTEIKERRLDLIETLKLMKVLGLSKKEIIKEIEKLI